MLHFGITHRRQRAGLLRSDFVHLEKEVNCLHLYVDHVVLDRVLALKQLSCLAADFNASFATSSELLRGLGDDLDNWGDAVEQNVVLLHVIMVLFLMVMVLFLMVVVLLDVVMVVVIMDFGVLSRSSCAQCLQSHGFLALNEAARHKVCHDCGLMVMIFFFVVVVIVVVFIVVVVVVIAVVVVVIVVLSLVELEWTMFVPALLAGHEAGHDSRIEGLGCELVTVLHDKLVLRRLYDHVGVHVHGSWQQHAVAKLFGLEVDCAARRRAEQKDCGEGLHLSEQDRFGVLCVYSGAAKTDDSRLFW